MVQVVVADQLSEGTAASLPAMWAWMLGADLVGRPDKQGGPGAVWMPAGIGGNGLSQAAALRVAARVFGEVMAFGHGGPPRRVGEQCCGR